jgi:pimeloyl-ACP methyl ester carboxylesterase
MVVVEHAQLETNGASLHVAAAGDRDAPPVLLLHGVPELWYSWRHQLPALAEAGYRAVAADTRGCGGSVAPPDVASYSMRHLVGDVIAVLDELDLESAVLVGHDWGAETAWQCARSHPDRVSAVVGLSVGYTARPPEPPTVMVERFAADVFSFVRYCQEPGVAECELDADPRRSLLLLYYALSADAPPGLLQTMFRGKPRDAKLLDGIPEPAEPLRWLTGPDLDRFAAEYARTGFTGALNRYRNLDRDWAESAHRDDATVEQPALFIGGDRDSAVVFGDLSLTRALPQIRDVVVLADCGHWVQQERPTEVNTAIVQFLRSLR